MFITENTALPKKKITIELDVFSLNLLENYKKLIEHTYACVTGTKGEGIDVSYDYLIERLIKGSTDANVSLVNINSAQYTTKIINDVMLDKYGLLYKDATDIENDKILKVVKETLEDMPKDKETLESTNVCSRDFLLACVSKLICESDILVNMYRDPIYGVRLKTTVADRVLDVLAQLYPFDNTEEADK